MGSVSHGRDSAESRELDPQTPLVMMMLWGEGGTFSKFGFGLVGPPITVSGLGTMWNEIPMSPASRCLNMSQIRCNLRIFDFLGFAVRPDEAYVYASTGMDSTYPGRAGGFPHRVPQHMVGI